MVNEKFELGEWTCERTEDSLKCSTRDKVGDYFRYDPHIEINKDGSGSVGRQSGQLKISRTSMEGETVGVKWSGEKQ